MRRLPWAFGLAALVDLGLGALLLDQAWLEPHRTSVGPWDGGDAAVAGVLALAMGMVTFAGVASLVESLTGLDAPRFSWHALVVGLLWALAAATLLPPLHDRAAEAGSLRSCLAPEGCSYACPGYLEHFPQGPGRAQADDAWFACARDSLAELRRYARQPGARHLAQVAPAARAQLEAAARAYRARPAPALPDGRATRALLLAVLESASRAGLTGVSVVFDRAVDWDGHAGHRPAAEVARALPGAQLEEPGYPLSEGGLAIVESTAADELGRLSERLVPAPHPGARAGLAFEKVEMPPPEEPYLQVSYTVWPTEPVLGAGKQAYYGLAMDWTLRLRDGDRPATELRLTSRSRGAPGPMGPLYDAYFQLELQAFRDLGRQLGRLGGLEAGVQER